MSKTSDIDWQFVDGNVSPEALEAFQAALERPAPSVFLRLIQESNGGSPRRDAFFYLNPETGWRVRSCLGQLISFDKEDPNNILHFLADPPEGFDPALVPFGLVGNGDLVCLKKGPVGTSVFLWRGITECCVWKGESGGIS